MVVSWYFILIFYMRVYLYETSSNIQEAWPHDLYFTVHIFRRARGGGIMCTLDIFLVQLSLSNKHLPTIQLPFRNLHLTFSMSLGRSISFLWQLRSCVVMTEKEALTSMSLNNHLFLCSNIFLLPYWLKYLFISQWMKYNICAEQLQGIYYIWQSSVM